MQLEIEKHLLELNETLKKVTEAYVRQRDELECAIKQQKQKLQLLLDGSDLQRVELAESVLKVRGLYKNAGEDRRSVIEDAIKEFASNRGAAFAHKYFGTKDCAHWHGQRCDCSYGMGPKHGWIVFSIGLESEARKRDLSDEELNAVLYYLRSIDRIQNSKETAKAA